MTYHTTKKIVSLEKQQQNQILLFHFCVFTKSNAAAAAVSLACFLSLI